MMGFILQLVGDFHYRIISYRIEGKIYETKLVAQALRKVYTNHRVILLAPESLALKLNREVEEIPRFLKEPKQLERHIREEIKEKGLMEEPFEVLMIQSTGLYAVEERDKQYHASFSNHIDNVVLNLFWNLLELGCDKDDVIVDASTGHNIYVTSLLESVRALIVYSKLHSLLQGKPDLRVRLVTAPPVLRNTDSLAMALPVNLYEYDVKAFFDFPLKQKVTGSATFFLKDDLSEEQKTEVGKALAEQCSYISKLMNSARLAFNSLKYNVPLAMFQDRLVNLEEPPETGLAYLEKILHYFENSRIITNDSRHVTITRQGLDRARIMNTVFSLALLVSLRKFWEEVKKVKPTTKEIRQLFENMYKKAGLGLNARFLNRELDEVEDNSQKLLVGEEKLLNSLRSKDQEGQTMMGHPRYSDKKRNFFAHSGLLDEVVQVRREDYDNFSLNYLESKLEEIRRWLENPED